MQELREVLARSKFERYVKLSNRLAFLQVLQRRAEVVRVTSNLTICRDPKDDMLLALAVDGNADYLITGDQDLLVLHPFRSIRILSPADFLAHVERGAKPEV